MARPLRQQLPWALLALLGVASLAWLGLLGFVWTDYELEAAPSSASRIQGRSGRSGRAMDHPSASGASDLTTRARTRRALVTWRRFLRVTS